MDSWRQTFWLWTIILSLIASVVVCLIFILIHKCVFRKDSYESMTGIPEYVKVEEEASRLDTVSMDYDDIGEDKGSVGGEDYDDVG
ncbi:unnamed protein product [Merluccius merluccius]